MGVHQAAEGQESIRQQKTRSTLGRRAPAVHQATLGPEYIRQQKEGTTFLKLQNIFVQYKGIAQCFFSTNIRSALLERLLHSVHTFNSNMSIHKDYSIHFSSFIYGGSHEDKK